MLTSLRGVRAVFQQRSIAPTTILKHAAYGFRMASKTPGESVDELNEEMSHFFGAASDPEFSPFSESNGGVQAQDVALPSVASRTSESSQLPDVNPTPLTFTPILSHVDSKGHASMVNVAQKLDTERVAIASARVLLGAEAFQQVVSNQIKKGDVLAVARIAGVQAAKHTPLLIPLCHNILIRGVYVDLTLDAAHYAVDVRARVVTVGPTGVEMEALTAASTAALTIYDMCKAVSKGIRITQIQLEHKSGGKSGNFDREPSPTGE
ncbi:Cyclic pyranopterin monophosphate synthase, mitochondrial [Cymbomonas tetramitiformis]|uniref:cyclic pyranopterin monophosphate synthase n=1 Tax=Cymbomonas tetramitiformis TaxID=36881 RepID=A0AAE0F459_9CHLO|nr:Cyclic pyranopterin monophosphate synthase, mitochondrial [Cymbomonas tetramitiformis]